MASTALTIVDDAILVEDQARRAQEAQERILGRLREIVGRLQQEADRRVGARRDVEKRWIDDLMQYHGRYDQSEEKAWTDEGLSRVFIAMTRPKTEAMEARLMDLLFPTDDKNWGIEPTPVPELLEAADGAAKQIAALRAQAMEGQNADPMAAQQTQAALGEAEALKARIDAAMDEARRRAKGMALEIEDQLVEGLYPAVNRDVIRDACKLGTGVLKGPVTGIRPRRGWKVDPDSGKFVLDMSGAQRPSPIHVDLWSFFPDMDVATIEESEGVFERHLMNKKALRRLARIQGGGFDRDAIRRVMESGAQRGGSPDYLQHLRAITGARTALAGDLFHVWEYNGPIEAEEMRDLALALVAATMDEDAREMYEATAADMLDVDPLEEVHACIWFCQGEVLKFALYPLDSGEPIYSVFNLFKDEASVFGYGIPHAIRHPQAMLNSAVRMLMDGAKLSTGEQILVDKARVEPENGDWRMEPRKVWLWDSDQGAAGIEVPPFQTFRVGSDVNQIVGIIELAERFIDALAGLPQIAQGEQGMTTTQTAGGMAILMNSANVVFRRIVKNYDDDITVPTIRRWYDWNMQFSPKEDIKGDFEIDARGSSVLLIREMQAQNLGMLLQAFGHDPEIGPMLRKRDLFERYLQANMIPASSAMKSESEHNEVEARIARAVEAAVQQMQQEMAAQGSQGGGATEVAMIRAEVDREKLAMRAQSEEADRQLKLALAQINENIAILRASVTQGVAVEKIQADLYDRDQARQSEERIVATEAAMHAKTGNPAGGRV